METTKKYLLILTGMAALFAGDQQARAAFELNFLPSPDIINGSQSSEITYSRCHMRGTVDEYCFHGGGGNAPAPDFTPFLREYVSVAGVTYVHMIVGELDPITGLGFAQETYIQANSGAAAGNVYSSSGGKPGCFSSNNNICGGSTLAGANTLPWQSGNGQIATVDTVGDPLSGNQQLTGNGTGDPKRAIIRQVLKVNNAASGTNIDQEFLKASLLLKPKISQLITQTSTNGVVMRDEFSLDMSAIDYNTNAKGVMVNKFTINDPDVPSTSRFVDAVANAQFSDISGGQYTFTSGTGWVDNTIHATYATVVPCVPANPNLTCTRVTPADDVWVFDQGSYVYTRGGADINNIDWKSFKNPFENALNP